MKISAYYYVKKSAMMIDCVHMYDININVTSKCEYLFQCT
jgi:hypothetical protein